MENLGLSVAILGSVYVVLLITLPLKQITFLPWDCLEINSDLEKEKLPTIFLFTIAAVSSLSVVRKVAYGRSASSL